MRIDIVSDTVCPWCYIGKKRLERALAQRPDLEVEIGWRPFQLNPDMPAEGADRAQYLAAKFGNSDRLKEMSQHLANMAAGEGIAVDMDRQKRIPNTLASHSVMRWAAEAGVQHRLAEILFRRYFTDGQDIGDHAILADAAAEAGMDRAQVLADLASGKDRDTVAAEDQLARDMGISGVPCFIIDRKYAVSGAQDPAMFLQVFDKVLAEET